MDIVPPNIVTVWKKPEYNFEFRVLAYRHLNNREMQFALKRWMKQDRRKTIPKNQTITYQTIIGFDCQEFL